MAFYDESVPYDNIRINSGMVIFRPSEKIEPRYLYLFLKSDLFQHQVKSHLTGSAQPQLPIRDINILRFTLPPLSEQKRIAEILGSLDDKIELNRKQNETLEAMARAVFQSWFVDFDPVIDNALAAGRPIPDELAEKAARRKHHKTKHPLPQAIQSLFPNRFEPSPLGPIPKGWKVKSLDNIADFLNGLACQKYPPENDLDSLPVIKIRELRQGITDNTDRATSNVPEKYIIQDGDVLFSWSGSLLVKIWCEGYGVLNQHVFKVSSADYPKWFYYYWTHHHLEVFQGIAADKATTMGHIQRRHLSDAKTLIPDEKLLDKMSKTITPLLDKQIASELESKTLTQLRSSLLPKLLTGEIEV